MYIHTYTQLYTNGEEALRQGECGKAVADGQAGGGMFQR